VKSIPTSFAKSKYYFPNRGQEEIGSKNKYQELFGASIKVKIYLFPQSLWSNAEYLGTFPEFELKH